MQKTQKHISVDFWRFLACFCPQVVGGFVLPSFEHQKSEFFLFATPGRKFLLIRVAPEKNNKDLYMPQSRHTCYIRPKCPSSMTRIVDNLNEDRDIQDIVRQASQDLPTVVHHGSEKRTPWSTGMSGWLAQQRFPFSVSECHLACPLHVVVPFASKCCLSRARYSQPSPWFETHQ